MTTPIPSAALLGSKRLLLVKSKASAIEAELLKATVSKTIVVPAYTRKDGVVVPAHTKVVHYDPSKDVGDVLSGKGSHSQKQAHKKLSKLPHWQSLEDSHKLAHILSSATNIQQKASASAAVSGWKASMLAGKKPTASQQAAFDALPEAKQAALLAEVGKPAAAPATFKEIYPPVDIPSPASYSTMSVFGGLENEGPVIHVNADFAKVEKLLGLAAGSLADDDSTTYTVENHSGQTFSVYKHGGGLSVRTSGKNTSHESAQTLAYFLEKNAPKAAAIASSPFEAAIKKVQGAPSLPLGDDFISNTAVTGIKPPSKAVKIKAPSKAQLKQPSQEVDIASIQTGQGYLSRSKLLGMLKEADVEKLKQNPVVIMEHEGQHYIVDGNHRLAALRLLGEKSLPAIVYSSSGSKAATAGPKDGDTKPADNSLDGINLPDAVKEYLLKPSVTMKDGTTITPKEFVDGLLVDGYGMPEYFAAPKGSQAGFLTKPGKPKVTLNDKQMFYADAAFMAQKKAQKASKAETGPKEGDTKPAADGGTLVLKDGHWVKQGGDAPVAKGDVFVLNSQYEKMNAGKWVVYNVSPDGEQVYMHKVGAFVPNGKNSATIPIATLQTAIAKGTAKKEAPAGATISGYKVTEDVNAVPMVHATTGDDVVASIKQSGFNLSNNSMYGKGVYFSDKDLSQSGGKYKTSLQVKLKPHKQLVLDSDLEVATALQKITGLSSGHLGSDKAREAFLAAGIGSLRFPVDGETYTVVLDPALIELPKAKAGKLSPEQKAKLDQMPWDSLLLPDSNSNAKTHNAQINKIKGLAYAGDVAGLQDLAGKKAGAKQTYVKKQHGTAIDALAALTAIEALKDGGAAPAANPLAGMSAAEAIAKNPGMPSLKLKEAWIDANADKVGAQAEWAQAFNPSPTVAPDPAPAKPERLPASQKKLIDDIATWPDAKHHLANIVSGGNPVAAAYAQQLLDAKKATVAVDKPKPPTGIEEHSEAGAYLSDAIYGLEHNDLPTLQDVITALQGEKPGHDEHKVLQFAKDAYKYLVGAPSAAHSADASPAAAEPSAAELVPMMEAMNSAGSVDAAKKVALRYLDAFPGSQTAINQVHDALANAGHASMAAAFAKDGQPGLEAFKPAETGTDKVKAVMFTHTEDGHSKFWAVSVHGSTVKTTYGKIGTKGSTTEKDLGSPSAAVDHAAKLAKQKQAKGYKEAGTVDHAHKVPAADTGPKEGDTKQGADGMLVFTDGRWHKLSEKAKAAIDSLSLDDLKEFADTQGMPVAQNAYIKAKLAGAEPMDSWQQTGGEDSDAWTFTEKDPGFSGVNTLIAEIDGQPVYVAYEPDSATFEAGIMDVEGGEPDSDHFTHPKEVLDYLAKKFGASLEMPSLGQVEKLAGKVSGETYSPKVPKPAAFVPSSAFEAMDGWKQTGPKGGSNPGGRFRDEHGVEWYCKFPESEDVAKSEVLAAKLYAALGISGQDCKLVTKGGKVGIASRWIDVKKATPAELAKLDGVASGFAADAWLANRDVVGMVYDNLQVGPDGKAHRLDAGGSLMYRATGGKKAFGPTVIELDGLRDKAINPQAAAVFGHLTQADIAASVAKVLALPDQSIVSLVNQFGPGDEASKQALAHTLIARKADLAAKFPQAVKAPKKRLDPTKLPVDASMLPKPHDFENWNGPGKGLSSKDHVNKANAAVEYQILGTAQQGNLNQLKAFHYTVIDKDSGMPTGKFLPIANHPSKHVVQYHSDLMQILDEIANPPEPLKVFQETDVSTIEQLAASLPPKKLGTTVDSVKSNEKLGFWVVLGVAPAAVKFKPKKVLAFTQEAIAAAKVKFSQGSALAKHFITSVQASGSYNDLFRNGKTHDHSGNKLADVAKAALAHATSQPEGTSVYRWQKMTDAMVTKILAAPDGTVFQATGPMCTSYDPTATKHFGPHRVTVRYAKGAKAVESFGSGGFKSEKEVTTLPNARFVILKKEMVPDVEHGKPNSKRLELEVLMLPPDLGL